MNTEETPNSGDLQHTCIQCLAIIRAQAAYAEQVLRGGVFIGLIHSGCIRDWQEYHPDDNYVPMEP